MNSKMFAVAALGAVLMFPSDSLGGPFGIFGGRRQAKTVQAPTNLQPTGPRQCRVVNGQLVCDPGPAATVGTATNPNGPTGNAPYGPGIAAPTRAPAPRKIASGKYIIPAGCKDDDGNGICDLHGNRLKLATSAKRSPPSVQEAVLALAATIERQRADRAAAEQAVKAAAVQQSHELNLAKIQAEADQKKQSATADIKRAEFESKLADEQSAKSRALQETIDQQAELDAAMSAFQELVKDENREPTPATPTE